MKECMGNKRRFTFLDAFFSPKMVRNTEQVTGCSYFQGGGHEGQGTNSLKLNKAQQHKHNYMSLTCHLDYLFFYLKSHPE